MKKVSIVIFALLCLWPKATPAADNGFNITVNVVVSDAGRSSSGSGGFWVKQNEYGRVSMTFPDDPLNFIITSSGAKQGPVSHFLKDQGKFQFSRSTPRIMADIYLEPALTTAGDIHLNGLLSKYTRASKHEPPLYAFAEQKLDFTISDGNKVKFTLDTGAVDENIILEISAQRSGSAEYNPPDKMNFSFEGQYSLLNVNTGKTVLAGKCILGSGDSDTDTAGSCYQQLLIPLSDKDTLLYMPIFDIGDLKQNDDGTLTFDLEICHLYSLNPIDFQANAEDINSEKTNITLYSKTITSRIGEKTEIDIPSESNSPLPFKSKEIFILTNSVSDN